MKNASLVAFSMLVTLIVGELFVRWFHYKEPWYEQLISEQKRNLTQPFEKNEFGLRDRNYSKKKQPSVRRILILGDSFTFGHGVEDASAVFPELLEVMLNEETVLPSVKRIDVLNGGISGSLTHHWLNLLSRVSDSFQPDIIIVVFFLRDGTRLGSIGSFFDPIRKEIAMRNRESLLYRYVYLYRLLRDHRDKFLISRRYIEELDRSYLGSRYETVEWQRAKRNILKIFRSSRERSVSVGLVVFPVLVNLNDDYYPFDPIVNLIVGFAKSNQIPVHNLLPAFRRYDGPELWVSPVDQHPNETAHRIAARSILPFAKELLKLSESMKKR